MPTRTRTRKSKVTTPTSTEGDNTVSTATFDLNALDVSTVETLPARGSNGSGRNDRFPDNPFVQRLRDSFAAPAGEGGRCVTVPVEHVTEVVAAIRNAADKLTEEEIGARIVFSFEREGDTVHTAKVSDLPKSDAVIAILFEGKTRKRYLSPDEKAEAIRVGLVKEGTDKPDSAAYLLWVSQDRPMTVEQNVQEHNEQNDGEVDQTDYNGPSDY